MILGEPDVSVGTRSALDVAARFAEADEERSRWLDEQIMAERAGARERPPQAKPRTPSRRTEGRRPGQTHCPCGRRLAPWNKSGACTPCRWEGPARRSR